jgi:ubiquinone/menaquinone biosynthesis C-methylase UbiE
MGDRYQRRYSTTGKSLYDVEARERKARTMVAVLDEACSKPLPALDLLDVGGSTGIMGHYLAGHFKSVASIDIDDIAVAHARRTYRDENLHFLIADALSLPFANERFDVVACVQVYEHVADARAMFEEIYRVLKPGGVCYLAANNRIRLMEPHYRLPLLSILPRWCAHRYLRLAGRGNTYYERHTTYWGLKSLARRFERVDCTRKVAASPERYHVDYMMKPRSVKALMARAVVAAFPWASPAYIWILRRPMAVAAAAQRKADA